MEPATSISRVAIVGASGNIGRFMTECLLKTGKHTITAITRVGSPSVFPETVLVSKVDYDDFATIVEALRGQQALVITISGRAPIQEIEEKLVRAAAAAGVPWILPNEWSPDTAHEGIIKDIPMFGLSVSTRRLIEDIGKSAYISVVTGFWYEWSLAMQENYGFDFNKRSVLLFDDGETKISTTTWPQIGRAVAAILSLPCTADSPKLSMQSLRNKVVYINSFSVTQKDMLASALRVTGTREEEWTVLKVPARQRYDEGTKQIAEGDKKGYPKLCSRLFFADGCGDFEQNKGVLNLSLGLPKEDIDDFTKIAIERQKGPAGH